LNRLIEWVFEKFADQLKCIESAFEQNLKLKKAKRALNIYFSFDLSSV
jgi:hypothetical protein